MHACLHLPEIVVHICDSLVDEPHINGFMRLTMGLAGSAASLARTCKSLQEPALNAL